MNLIDKKQQNFAHCFGELFYKLSREISAR